MCVYLQLKYPIRSGEVHLFPTAFMCCWLGLQLPAPLHPLLSLKKWKTVWLLWKSNYKNKYVYFQFISPPIPACSPQALASLLAATASHYLNSEFLSGFSQFSHTFNLWQNEWWLLSIKKKTTSDRLTAHTGGLVSRGDEVFLCATVWLFDGV